MHVCMYAASAEADAVARCPLPTPRLAPRVGRGPRCARSRLPPRRPLSADAAKGLPPRTNARTCRRAHALQLSLAVLCSAGALVRPGARMHPPQSPSRGKARAYAQRNASTDKNVPPRASFCLAFFSTFPVAPLADCESKTALERAEPRQGTCNGSLPPPRSCTLLASSARTRSARGVRWCRDSLEVRTCVVCSGLAGVHMPGGGPKPNACTLAAGGDPEGITPPQTRTLRR